MEEEMTWKNLQSQAAFVIDRVHAAVVAMAKSRKVVMEKC